MARALSSHLAFRARADFTVDVPSSARMPRQRLAAGEIGLVRHRTLRRQLLGAWRGNVDVLSEEGRLEVRPLTGLRGAGTALFAIPSDALGDSVMMANAVRTIAAAFGLRRIGVAFTGKSTDIWAHLGLPVDVYPLILPKRAIAGYDVVVDPAVDVPALRTLGEAMVTVDASVLAPLNLAAPTRWLPPRAARPVRRIGVLPLSSTPIRTLPPALTAHLARSLARRGYDIEIVVDPRQRQGALYADAMGEHPARLRTGLDTVDSLLASLDGLDYAIVCDSGPAHLTKMLGLPGFGIYTTVDAVVVQGGFTNLGSWQSRYVGRFCAAPCGLVGLMARRDRGAYGCMDSLAARRDGLVRPARLPDDETRRHLLETPVGCVAALTRDRDAILDAIVADIAQKSGSS